LRGIAGFDMTNLVVFVGDLLAGMSQQVKALNSLSTVLGFQAISNFLLSSA